MPDIQIEKESKFAKLNKEEKDDLADKISSLWREYHDKRKSQIETARVLSQYISLNQADRNSKQKWRSNIKENKLYVTWDSMKAGMWKEIWSNENQMFDVLGTSKEYEEVAERQKQAVVHALKIMEAGTQFDLATDNWALYGDFIFKTDWKSRKKKVKRFDPYQGMVEVELPLEENANIEAIDPMFFNFDVDSYKYGDKESWDRCPKIFKRFATIEEIKKNPLYKLTKDQIAELQDDSNDDTETSEHKDDNDLATMTKYNDQYEVLYFHGDIKLNNKAYHNVVAEVLDGQYLIFFEENPIYINPFVCDFTQRDPETGRGISPLKCILDMCKAKEDLLNKAGDVAEFNRNPCMWGNDTFLKEKYKNGVIPYEPGKYLDYDNSYQGGFPQPIKFDASGIEAMIGVLANDISDASSINANAMGNVTQGERKATDLQLAKAGGDSRTAMKLDKIYQINLKVIENVAELLAMFKTEPETLLVRDKGKRVAVEITNAIRQGSYYYVYEDRNALLDRRAKFQEAYSLLSGAAQNEELAQSIDWEEVLRSGLEMIGFDNADKFFIEPTQLDEIANTIKQMPEEVQGAIAQQIMPVVQQAMSYLQQQQGVQQQ